MSRLTFLYGLGDVAQRYGVDEAIFLHVIVNLALNNKDNNRNFHDGRWWTFNSLASWEQQFTWWTSKQIRRVIASCKEQGALLIGEYNKDRRDRTAWYSPSDEVLSFYREDWAGKCLCPDGQMREPERASYCAQTGTTIPKDTQRNLQEDNMRIHFAQIKAEVNKMLSLFADVEVNDDDRAANMAIMALLEKHGYLCQNDVPVPSRGDGKAYTGRVGIVATKDGVTFAIEFDRRSIRQKSLCKLREYPCDARIILLRNGNVTEIPDGIHAVFSLRVSKSNDDLFHRFWDAYPKKIDKRRSYEVFGRLKVTPELLEKMLCALEKQKKSKQWLEAKGQYIPYASTWLNGRRWEDEDKPLPARTADKPRPTRPCHVELIDGEEVVVYDG
jgi:DNA-binding MltR family transcriptional regulator